VLSEAADLHYKVSRFYDHADEGGLVWNDPEIAINWPVSAPRLSPRDAAYPKLAELEPAGLPHVGH
jgi:dTDP-4-dehydrorhamnose 3,5-epimerase